MSNYRLVAKVALDLPPSWDPSNCHTYADAFADLVFGFMISEGTILYHIEGEGGERVADPRPEHVDAEEWN